MYSNRVLSGRPLALVPIRRTKRTLATAAVAVKTGSTTTTTSSSSSVPTTVHARLWNLYSRNLEKRPLWTKALMASFIFFASDSATQYALPGENNLVPCEESSSCPPDGRRTVVGWRWDPARALSGAGFGVVATAWLHYWWGFLEASLGRALPASRHRLANTLAKVVVDQAVGAPTYIYAYYVLTNFLQDLQDGRVPALQSWQENNKKASEMLMPTMWQHWKVWPLVHSFNFYFTPLHHRVLVQVCSTYVFGDQVELESHHDRN